MEVKGKINIEEIKKQAPILKGKSKILYPYNDTYCFVELIPSLRSFSFNRDEMVDKTDTLRLDFYEMAANILEKNGVKVAFYQRTGLNSYLTEMCSNPPFEVIVKNYSVGSTQRKYPGLFPEGHKFEKPVVKFDYRVDPEDTPIADDYIREYGCDPQIFKQTALKINEILKQWLHPIILIDFCVIFGKNRSDEYLVTSEVSLDCMRLKSVSGDSFDKDLFRNGRSHEEIIQAWTKVVNQLKEKCQKN